MDELPDCILSHIVSLLKIKDAAKTSVVSRQWRYLWTTIRPNLEFDIPNMFGDMYTRLIEKYELQDLPCLVHRFNRQCFVRRVNNHLSLDLCDVESVVGFLKAAPLLEELLISTQSYGYHGEVKNLSGFSHDHLRKVKLQGFQGKRLEIELAICILKIATKLEVLVIDPLGKIYIGCDRWIICSQHYEDGNEDEDVDSEEERDDENDGEDVGMNDDEVEEGSEHEGVDETVDEIEALDKWDKDELEYKLLGWERRGRAVVQERLKEVETDAQVTIL